MDLHSIKTSILVIAAGGSGALCRYLVSRAFFLLFPHIPLHYATLLINSLGCFFLAVVWVCAAEYRYLSEEVRVITSLGFIGAFTTFSSYIFELYALIRDKLYAQTILYFVLQNICGFLFFMLGLYLCKYIFSLLNLPKP